MATRRAGGTRHAGGRTDGGVRCEARQEFFWRMFSRHPGAGRGPFRRGTTICKALSVLENSGAAARWVPALAGKTIDYFAGRAARLVFLPSLFAFPPYVC